MSSYQKIYLALFNAITDALQQRLPFLEGEPLTYAIPLAPAIRFLSSYKKDADFSASFYYSFISGYGFFSLVRPSK